MPVLRGEKISMFKRVIRKLFNKQYAYGEYKSYEEYHRAYVDEITQRIRNGGGKVGQNVDFYDLKIDDNNLFSIGNNVTLTQCRLLTHDACLTRKTGCVRVAPIIIGDNVFVGADAIILPGTKIGSNVIVGAGAVVAHDIPDNSVVVGNPCKVVCKFDEFVERESKTLLKNDLLGRDCMLKDFSSEHHNYRYVVVNNGIYQKFLSDRCK